MATNPMMLRPQIILLKEGTDTSQGKGQLLTNMDACLAVAETVRTTLGPRGMDKLIVDDKGRATITNDGATILKLLDVVHPVAKTLVEVAKSQDIAAGDGTTSIVIFAAELMKEAKAFIEEGVSPRYIIQGYRLACQVALESLHVYSRAIQDRIQVASANSQTDASAYSVSRAWLEKCAKTAMTSKLIASQESFFANLVVQSILHLGDDCNLKRIAIKKVPGGGIQDTEWVDGVSFKKTFSYAGFEQQPKLFHNAKILCLNMELELKAERENAELRLDKVSEYAAVVEAEWRLFYDKLDKIAATDANIVLSRLPIGDLATQYFAEKGMFCSGRVAQDDIDRVCMATGAKLMTTLTSSGDINQVSPMSYLGQCGLFEERQVGHDRYNFFKECPQSRTCTFLLRGGSEQLMSEVERALMDSLMVVKRALETQELIVGGGAIDMSLSVSLRDWSKKIHGKLQPILLAFSKALECIPRQLAENAGLDSIALLNSLRKIHYTSHMEHKPSTMGLDILQTQGVGDMLELAVCEPTLLKRHILTGATEVACLILSIDETIQAPKHKQ